MTAVRHNLITGEPVLFAPERAGRPNAFAHHSIDLCPFCPGNEAMTPAELARIERNGTWTARAFPNKYPAARHHEVIVESPDHSAGFESIEDAPATVQLYLDRYAEMRKRDGVAYPSLFKNHGRMAGASIEHLHSQLLGVPALPPRIAREAEAFSRTAACPLCAESSKLIVREAEAFLWVAPYASTMPYHQWIVPRRHISEPTGLKTREAAELAALLQSAAAGMTRIAPSYNWSFVSFPTTPAGHFYVELFPRLTAVAGFELGTGMFIEVIDPALTVQRMNTR
jgi:UDPglucose--hexose-1-phosphate uridylyltransferase